jgi:hypothetical protein
MLKIKPIRIADLVSLRYALQKAIELEHATIPPYLTAYYTLHGTSAGGVAARQILRSIVVEEMLHMHLACNILNAIGGAPVINAPDFIPNYPGPLPMGIGGADGLVVGIKRYSKATVQNTFMEIEEPENPIHIPVKPALESMGPGFETIGQFYTAIGNEITRQPNSIFTGDPGLQVPGALIVKDVDSALAAIATIVTQGEGTPTSPADSPTERAHYYRFEELYKGMRIVVDPSSPIGYSFDPNQTIVVDDTADVTQMADNPRTVDFSSNWRAGQLADECDAIYTKLLNALHIGFNGQPDWIDGNAVSVMFEFKNCIEELLQQQLADGLYAGPRFLYADREPARRITGLTF